MKNLLSLLGSTTALLLVSPNVEASQVFNYSYTFSSGVIVTGEFKGTAVGNLVTDLSDISLLIDGTAIHGSGSLFGSHFLSPNAWASGGAVASFDGRQNNLMFIDVDYPLQYMFSGLFQSYSDPDFADYLRGTNYANAYNYFTGQAAYDKLVSYASPYEEARWTLVPSSSLPEPGSLALVALAMVGLRISHRFAGRAK